MMNSFAFDGHADRGDPERGLIWFAHFQSGGDQGLDRLLVDPDPGDGQQSQTLFGQLGHLALLARE